jgi:translation initiation factor IF-2
MNNSTTDKRRVPIVSILGHVDHGKTTILDLIRKTEVQLKEAGGITQKISVFTVDVPDRGLITFVDTPGHEAFDLMRTRGGTIADIVLLIVAANDGVKPQTKESIEIIKNSKAKPIVVINKIDLPNIDIESVKRQVVAAGLQVEGLGGDVPVVGVSAKTGEGIDKLLDMIMTVAEIEGLIDRGELPAHSSGRGYVLESVKDNARGFVSSVVTVQGSFNKGDILAYRKGDQVVTEKIKGFISEEGANLDGFKEGYGGRILGLSAPIDLGTEVYVTSESDKKSLAELSDLIIIEQAAKEIVEEETSDDILAKMFGNAVEETTDEKKNLNVVVKASSEGALEAIKKSLARVDVDGNKVNILRADIGEITSNDVDKASVTKSIMLAFEVGINPDAVALAKERKVLIRQYSIIYKIVEEVTDALTLIATPQETEEDLGQAEVKAIFVLSNGKKILGGRVKTGMLKRNASCYVVRDDEIIGTGRITSLRTNKSEINEATKGVDFGAMIDPEVDAKEGDEIHCFKIVKVTFG